MNLKAVQQAQSSFKSNEKTFVAKEVSKKVEAEKKPFLFFEEMRDNIMILFNPYKMDSLLKQNTYLNKKSNSYTKGLSLKNIPIKIQLLEKKVLNHKDLSQKSNKEELSDSSVLESVPIETRPKTKKQTELELLQKRQGKYDEQNREQLLQILGNQKFFFLEGKFSFLMNVFSEEEEALDYAKEMKEKHPFWSFLIKAHKDHIRIYLGPFKTKEKALEFKEMTHSSVSQDFLEEVSL